MDRISSLMRFQTQRRTLASAQILQQRAQERASSGRRITRASDDPSGASAVLRLRATLSQAEAFLQTIEQVRSTADTAEVAISQLQTSLSRAAELGIQGANGTLDASNRKAIAVEVDGILAHAVSLGNAQLNGRYIFAGSQTTQKPFTVDGEPVGAVTYRGDQVMTPVLVNAGVEVQTSLPGNLLAEAGGGLFEALVALRDALSNEAGLSEVDQVAAIREETGRLQTAGEDVGYLRSKIGVQQHRAEEAESLVTLVQERAEEARSRLEDFDFAQAATEYLTANQNLQATLATAARTLRVSLLDYLT